MKLSIASGWFSTCVLIPAAMMFSSCDRTPEFTGYRLIEKRFVKEVNADCYLFEHIKSGAHVLKIAADDPNKTFSIAFSTLPESDAGTPHIMEHCVLNGSKNFPVKSPFDVLSKGSLNTFLNAMTYPDFTVFPVASMNEKDYYNLMHVYCDAVLNPLIYDDPRIFKQEGWHYELTSHDAPLEYKGVVYNEMKGAFSSPTRELWYQIQKNLFPDNGFRYSSGGYPSAIPSLTYEDFLGFHRRHYHPSNSFIYLYGDADMKVELAFLDREYLSKYDKSEALTAIPKSKPFDTLRVVTSFYPVLEGAPTDDQTYLAMNWVIGEGADQAAVIALDVLADVLVNQESAPVRKALQSAGIGKDVFATSQNMQQNMFSIVVKNANSRDKDRFREVVMNTLHQVVDEKIDRETLEGSLNRLEFRLREGDDAQKGLTFHLRSLTGWLYTGNPFPSLEYEPQLANVKKSLESTYLEDIIQNDMVSNPHGVLIVLEPKPGLEKQNAEIINAALADQRKKFTPAELDTLVSTTRALMAYQQREDTPEALATIPLLALKDINPKAQWYEATEHKTGGVTLLHHEEFTNNIVYMNYWFDLRVLPQDKIPYAALLTELLGKMDAGRFGYEQLDKSLNINTGGFNTGLNVFLPENKDDKLMPQLRIQIKTTTEKLDSAMTLLAEILNDTRLDNRERLLELMKRHQSQLELYMIQNGYNVAVTRLESYFSQRGMFNEMTRGAGYYWFINDLLHQFETNPDEILASLEQVMELLFTRNCLMAGTTCSRDDFERFTPLLESLVASLPDRSVTAADWSLSPEPLNEGILTSSKVQYVLAGYDFRKLGMAWDGKWNVLSQIMSTDWLQTRVRVMGGAYGGFSSISRNGTIYMASYRDPNLKETLGNFNGTVNYLAAFDADTTAMTRYIIGTIANLDYPLTPSEKGDMAFRWHIEKITQEQVQADRDAVLATTADDISGMSKVIGSILDQNVYCVYGNEEKLKANKDLFKKLVVLQK